MDGKLRGIVNNEELYTFPWDKDVGDFPIITGKDVMIQAEFHGYRGQAFTDAPASFSGTIEEVLKLDIVNNTHDRGIFIASLNAVMGFLKLCTCTVHCRTLGPEDCACDMADYLNINYPGASRIGLIGYQPALLEMLSGSGRDVKILDLNPANIGQKRYGIPHSAAYLKLSLIYNRNTYSKTYYTQENGNNNSFYICICFFHTHQNRVGIHQYSGGICLYFWYDTK